jgi:hypothetical protein
MLTARRRNLQAECELLRDDVRQVYDDIEQRTSRADRMIETARRFAPVVAIGGAVVLFALGPRRALALVRRSLTIALYAKQARHTLLG